MCIAPNSSSGEEKGAKERERERKKDNIDGANSATCTYWAHCRSWGSPTGRPPSCRRHAAVGNPWAIRHEAVSAPRKDNFIAYQIVVIYSLVQNVSSFDTGLNFWFLDGIFYLPEKRGERGECVGAISLNWWDISMRRSWVARFTNSSYTDDMMIMWYMCWAQPSARWNSRLIQFHIIMPIDTCKADYRTKWHFK